MGLACLCLLRAAWAMDAPEAASGFQPKPGWRYPHRAVASAHPLASQAGLRILREGGNALDAAVAVQMVLALVEPQSSGLGGGAFLLHHDGQRLQAWDGRETAPAQATEDLFLEQGQPMPLSKALAGGRAVGVPGVVRMLEEAHRQQGRLPWARLFSPAIELAREGFPVSQRLHSLLAQDSILRLDPVAAAYFYQADGKPWGVGHRLKNPELARLLERIAQEGSVALHEGLVAQALVHKVQTHASNPGRLSLEDLAAYRPRERRPLCFDTASAQGLPLRVCGFPPRVPALWRSAKSLGFCPGPPLTPRPARGVPHGYTVTPKPLDWRLQTGRTMWQTQTLSTPRWATGQAFGRGLTFNSAPKPSARSACPPPRMANPALNTVGGGVWPTRRSMAPAT